MSLGGHIVGERKLRRLAALTGLPLNRAYILTRHRAEGVVWTETRCEHYAIDPVTGEHQRQTRPVHWTRNCKH